MKSTSQTKVSIGKRAADELKEFAVIAAYLYVCFTAILYLKASILKAHGIAFAPFGFAAVKALICAKFVSVGHILHVGERFKSLPLIWVACLSRLVARVKRPRRDCRGSNASPGYLRLACRIRRRDSRSVDRNEHSWSADIDPFLCLSHAW